MRGEKDVVSTYIREASRYPLLNHDESVSLFVKAKEGDLEARKKLIESNLRLVVSIAKSYRTPEIAFEDLVQEGNLGLIKSVERYDHRKGFRFSTYATWWIRQAIGQHVLKRKRTIRMPAHALGVQKRLIAATEEYRKQFDVEPTLDELTELTGASRKVIKATIEACRKVVSLDDLAFAGSNGATIGDTIPDKGENDPFSLVHRDELIAALRNAMRELTPREEVVIRLRFGIVDAHDHEKWPITEDEVSSLKRGEPLR